MRILPRSEFVKLPGGTLFSYYEPSAFRGLLIKKSDYAPEMENDFYVIDLIGAIDCTGSTDYGQKCDVMEAGGSVPMDFTTPSREGLFDDKLLYAVYEPADVRDLISALKLLAP